MNYKYRKKAVVVEAFQMTYARRWDNKDWPEWLNAAWQKEAGTEGALYIDDSVEALVGEKEGSAICIGTLEGPLQITWDAYIIKGVKSELYPCRSDIFESTYDDVEADTEELELGDETSEITQFTRAIDAIAMERLYQEKLWGPTEAQGRHNVTEFLVFIQDYVDEALHTQSRIASPAAENITRHSIRKIASLAIACMEQNGVSGRDMDDLEKKRQEHLA